MNTHVFDCGYSKEYFFEQTLNDKLLDVLEHYDRYPTLIFCATRDATSNAAQKLESDVSKRFYNSSRESFILGQQTKMILADDAKMVKSTTLKQLLPKRIGFHNAALEHDDRDLVENFFRDRRLLALTSTRILSLGVNLPARLVVVRGTKKYSGNGS